jgi:hypothetical protein
MEPLNVRIVSVDPEREAVFGFASVDESMEGDWYAAVASSCPPQGGACRVGEADLLEMFILTPEKSAALGLDRNPPSGLWLGLRVEDEETLDAIRAGGVTSFRLAVAPEGLEVEFTPPIPESQDLKRVTTTTIKGDNTMICSKCAQPALVSKCLAAVEKDDLSGMRRADFDAALTALAEAHAKESGLSRERAYAAMLQTDEGKRLYSGYVNCPPVGPA